MSQPPKASDKPRFSAGLVTFLVALIWVGMFAFFIMKGAQGFH